MTNTTAKQKILVLIGPTAVGKTRLSIDLAQALEAEIISCDSMQFYRGMDIGTAKITEQERCGIPHHLIDIKNPAESVNVAEFQQRAALLIEQIAERGKLPLLVGGTGLYVNALLHGYTLAQQVGENTAIRAALAARFAAGEGHEMWLHLQQVDAASAAKIHENDQQRLVRALEVFESTGEQISQQAQAQTAPYAATIIGLIRPREELYRRIEERVDLMLEQGLVEEVRGLLAQGIPREANAMQGLGYRQIGSYLYGECTLTEAVRLLKRDTRHFAKRQLTWWRRDEQVLWFDPTEYATEEQLSAAVLQAIAQQ